MSSLGWAAALSVLSAISYAGAAVVQERLAAAGHRGLSRWAGSLLLTGLGAALHFVALGFGTVGVVQALGTLTLLFALPIAAWRTRSPIGTSSWRDAALTVAGLIGLITLTAVPTGSDVLTPTAGRYLALGTFAVVVAVMAGIGAATGVVGLSRRTAVDVLRRSDLVVAG